MVITEPIITDTDEGQSVATDEEVVFHSPRHGRAGRVTAAGLAALGLALSACGGEEEAPRTVEVAAGSEGQGFDTQASPVTTLASTSSTINLGELARTQTEASPTPSESKLIVRGHEVRLARADMAPQAVLDAFATNYTTALTYTNPTYRAQDVARQVAEAMEFVDPQLSPEAVANGHRDSIVKDLTSAHNARFNDPFHEPGVTYRLIEWKGSVQAGYAVVTYEAISGSNGAIFRKTSSVTLNTISVQGQLVKVWQFDKTAVNPR